jgi:putative ABC transport system substrate-binding protein
MTSRRQALVGSAWALAIGMRPLLAQAQSRASGLPRVGLLLSESIELQAARIKSLRDGLESLGLVEGRTIAFEIRSANGDYTKLPELAAELVRMKVDVIVAFGIKALSAAHAETRSIPLVVPATSSDLVAMGYAKSLARPEGNITGSTTFGPEIMAKRLELAKELNNQTDRVGVLMNPANSSFRAADRELEAAARHMKVSVVSRPVRSISDFESAITAFAKTGVDAVVVQDDTLFTDRNAEAIAAISLRQRLASIGGVGFAAAGGTLGYGRSDADLYRRGATFVASILKGQKVAEMPIEQASRFELVINLNSIKALGIRVSPALAARADRVIE